MTCPAKYYDEQRLSILCQTRELDGIFHEALPSEGRSDRQFADPDGLERPLEPLSLPVHCAMRVQQLYQELRRSSLLPAAIGSLQTQVGFLDLQV